MKKRKIHNFINFFTKAMFIVFLVSLTMTASASAVPVVCLFISGAYLAFYSWAINYTPDTKGGKG